jgi:hypothetical protein
MESPMQVFPITRLQALHCPSSRGDFYIAEASELSFPVGRWPRLLLLEGDNIEAELLHHRRVDGEGDSVIHVYEGIHTCLHVLND